MDSSQINLDGVQLWHPMEYSTSNNDRDHRALQCAAHRGNGRQRLEPKRASGSVQKHMSGGAILRSIQVPLGPSREDVVQMGYAKYIPPSVDISGYAYYYLAGWRIAIPKSASADERAYLINRVIVNGPSDAGYSLVGDTLVPMWLDASDKAALSG